MHRSDVTHPGYVIIYIDRAFMIINRHQKKDAIKKKTESRPTSFSKLILDAMIIPKWANIKFSVFLQGNRYINDLVSSIRCIFIITPTRVLCNDVRG